MRDIDQDEGGSDGMGVLKETVRGLAVPKEAANGRTELKQKAKEMTVPAPKAKGTRNAVNGGSYWR